MAISTSKMLTQLTTHPALIGRTLFIGILSGFPQILIGSLLSLWLKEAGVSKSVIGAFGLVSVFYTFNWLFAPILDRYHGLGLGRRRFWLLMTQSVILVACVLLSQIDISAITHSELDGGINNGTLLKIMLAVAVLLIAFASSLQDVTIDALRIEMIPVSRQDLMAIGSAFAVIGWYAGFNLGGALGLRMYDALKHDLMGGTLSLLEQLLHRTLKHDLIGGTQVWQQVFCYLAGFWLWLMIISQIILLKVPDSSADMVQISDKHWLQKVFVEPFESFIADKGLKLTLMLLGFLFLFKLGEAFLGRMSIVFYKEVGFTEKEIADYAKIIGWVVFAVFSLVGGVLAGRFGVWRGLMIGGIAMASTNLLFALLAIVGPSVPLLVVAVVSDQFTTAFATVSFVAFISLLCDRHYTASQYALLASVGSFSRMLLAASSGFVLEHWLGDNWVWFFILTSVMVVPALVLLWMMRKEAKMFGVPVDI